MSAAHFHPKLWNSFALLQRAQWLAASPCLFPLEIRLTVLGRRPYRRIISPNEFSVSLLIRLRFYSNFSPSLSAITLHSTSCHLLYFLLFEVSLSLPCTMLHRLFILYSISFVFFVFAALDLRLPSPSLSLSRSLVPFHLGSCIYRSFGWLYVWISHKIIAWRPKMV